VIFAFGWPPLMMKDAGRPSDPPSHVFHGFGDRGRLPRDATGRLDWTHRGPNGDLQFACRVNRHHFLGALLYAYESTHQRRYLHRLDDR
jgi:hypothetical protein